MSKFYEFAYAVGFTPWEQAAKVSLEATQELFQREEAERGGPGKALDVGCGSGLYTLALAERGWDVTGADLVDRAIDRARRRLAEAGADAKIVKADATVLPADAVGGDFDFVLDIGCFHGLTAEQRSSMARAVTARTKPDATLLMLAFNKPVGPPFMPAGATQEQIERAFTGWDIIDVVTPSTSSLPRLARRAEPRFYRLRKS
ncbi:class I SAM-dependent methyltransferase [Mycolicibacterium sp. lyk4-40-TYG-92]|uniref:class I SAM-dependent methyltransferase n=1 Tax=Mycolicibacterium sp. lyk4-40-TYG-92 TaxID=3040295 RepID=UPI00254D4D6B|nr:class I SAM-dependent methyltransferase [Mycolicibacterium sp. lyk4-40-TYG-92]